jgi:hypothetical protein
MTGESEMRKRYKDKKRSCGLCKPHKRKWSKRWKVKDMVLEERFFSEKEQMGS